MDTMNRELCWEDTVDFRRHSLCTRVTDTCGSGLRPMGILLLLVSGPSLRLILEKVRFIFELIRTLERCYLCSPSLCRPCSTSGK